jgi:hypothetical protein
LRSASGPSPEGPHLDRTRWRVIGLCFDLDQNLDHGREA